MSVVPWGYATPAGLRASASPPLVDAPAAPARDVDTAPEPGKYQPPADATDDDNNTAASAIPHFIQETLPQPFDAREARCASTGSRSPPV